MSKFFKKRTKKIGLPPGTLVHIGEKEGDVFNPIRERIRNYKGRIRKMGADHLAYKCKTTIPYKEEVKMIARIKRREDNDLRNNPCNPKIISVII